MSPVLKFLLIWAWLTITSYTGLWIANKLVESEEDEP